MTQIRRIATARDELILDERRKSTGAAAATPMLADLAEGERRSGRRVRPRGFVLQPFKAIRLKKPPGSFRAAFMLVGGGRDVRPARAIFVIREERMRGV